MSNRSGRPNNHGQQQNQQRSQGNIQYVPIFVPMPSGQGPPPPPPSQNPGMFRYPPPQSPNNFQPPPGSNNNQRPQYPQGGRNDGHGLLPNPQSPPQPLMSLNLSEQGRAGQRDTTQKQPEHKPPKPGGQKNKQKGQNQQRQQNTQSHENSGQQHGQQPKNKANQGQHHGQQQHSQSQGNQNQHHSQHPQNHGNKGQHHHQQNQHQTGTGQQHGQQSKNKANQGQQHGKQQNSQSQGNQNQHHSQHPQNHGNKGQHHHQQNQHQAGTAQHGQKPYNQGNKRQCHFQHHENHDKIKGQHLVQNIMDPMQRLKSLALSDDYLNIGHRVQDFSCIENLQNNESQMRGQGRGRPRNRRRPRNKGSNEDADAQNKDDDGSDAESVTSERSYGQGSDHFSSQSNLFTGEGNENTANRGNYRGRGRSRGNRQGWGRGGRYRGRGRNKMGGSSQGHEAGEKDDDDEPEMGDQSDNSDNEEIEDLEVNADDDYKSEEEGEEDEEAQENVQSINRDNRDGRGKYRRPRRGHGSLARGEHFSAEDNNSSMKTFGSIDNMAEFSRGGGSSRGRGGFIDKAHGSMSDLRGTYKGSPRGGHRGRGSSRGQQRGRGGHGWQSSNENIPRWTSEDSLTTQNSPIKPRVHNDSENSDDIEIDENKVFTFLVQEFGGKSKYEDFKAKCSLFPPGIDIDLWFRRHRRRFRLFDQNDIIYYISAFYRDASFCLNYTRISAKNGCQKPNECEYFHICKDFLTGSCHFKDQCMYSHSFSDEFNHKRKLNLGLEVFSDKDIAAILCHRFPHVCENSIQDKSCFKSHCPNLHICCKYLVGKCFRETCNVGHCFTTPHNTWILQAFQMENWPKKNDKLLRRVVVFPRLKDSANYEDDHPTQTTTPKDLVEVSSGKQMTESQNIQELPVKSSRKNRKFSDDVAATEFISSVEPTHVEGLSFGYDESLEEISADTEVIPEQDGKGKRKGQRKMSDGTSESSDMKKVGEEEIIYSLKPKQTGAIPKKKTDAWKDVTPEGTQEKGKPVPQEKGKPSITPNLNEDAASNKNICNGYIEGKCSLSVGKCKSIHTGAYRIPYLWQIKLYGKWVTFPRDDNEELENRYCQLDELCDAKVNVEGMDHSVHILYNNGNDMEAIVYSIDDAPSMSAEKNPVRRLSTKSYCKCTNDKGQGYSTQWRWYWKDDNGLWQLYEKDIFQYTMEKKYLDEQKVYLFTRSHFEFKYRIDFVKFEQLNMDTLKTRQICRRPLFVSPSDVLNNQLPNSFMLPTSPPRPPGWAVWDCANDFELVEIDPKLKEYNEAVKWMYETIDKSKLDIEMIYRIQNAKLWREFDVKKKNMTEDRMKEGLENVQFERMLFHGTTSIKTCEGICTNNFDFRISGKNGTMWGEGAYFASTAKYSNNYARNELMGDQRYMFLAKVLVGEYTKGDSSYKRPPERQGHKLYDTCVDKESDPSIFVVFDRSQCYPLYLIVYKYLDVPPARPATMPAPLAYGLGIQDDVGQTSGNVMSPVDVQQNTTPPSPVVSPSMYSNPYQHTGISYPGVSSPSGSHVSSGAWSPVDIGTGVQSSNDNFVAKYPSYDNDRISVVQSPRDPNSNVGYRVGGSTSAQGIPRYQTSARSSLEYPRQNNVRRVAREKSPDKTCILQ